MHPFRILLPFDGGPAARRALLALAQRRLPALPAHLEVVLLNVQAVYLDGELRGQARAYAHLHRLDGEAILRPAAERLEEAGIPHRSFVTFGRPAEAIAATAERERCALIVMGARLRHPMVELATGSVSRDVMRLSRVPVMPVADPRWDSARASLEGAMA